MHPLLVVKKDENIEWKNEDITAFENIIAGYRECMPNVDDKFLKLRFLMNNHFLNRDFSKEAKYFIAFDDSNLSQDGIVVISALYVFPKYRKQNFGKKLIEHLQFQTANKNIVLQVAVNEEKHQNLYKFYETMGFKSTGHVNKADMLGIKYIDFFWSSSPIKLSVDRNGTAIERL